jgi:hypothetical protein
VIIGAKPGRWGMLTVPFAKGTASIPGRALSK